MNGFVSPLLEEKIEFIANSGRELFAAALEVFANLARSIPF